MKTIKQSNFTSKYFKALLFTGISILPHLSFAQYSSNQDLERAAKKQATELKEFYKNHPNLDPKNYNNTRPDNLFANENSDVRQELDIWKVKKKNLLTNYKNLDVFQQGTPGLTTTLTFLVKSLEANENTQPKPHFAFNSWLYPNHSGRGIDLSSWITFETARSAVRFKTAWRSLKLQKLIYYPEDKKSGVIRFDLEDPDSQENTKYYFKSIETIKNEYSALSSITQKDRTRAQQSRLDWIRFLAESYRTHAFLVQNRQHLTRLNESLSAMERSFIADQSWQSVPLPRSHLFPMLRHENGKRGVGTGMPLTPIQIIDSWKIRYSSVNSETAMRQLFSDIAKFPQQDAEARKKSERYLAKFVTAAYSAFQEIGKNNNLRSMNILDIFDEILNRGMLSIGNVLSENINFYSDSRRVALMSLFELGVRQSIRRILVVSHGKTRQALSFRPENVSSESNLPLQNYSSRNVLQANIDLHNAFQQSIAAFLSTRQQQLSPWFGSHPIVTIGVIGPKNIGVPVEVLDIKKENIPSFTATKETAGWKTLYGNLILGSYAADYQASFYNDRDASANKFFQSLDLRNIHKYQTDVKNIDAFNKHYIELSDRLESLRKRIKHARMQGKDSSVLSREIRTFQDEKSVFVTILGKIQRSAHYQSYKPFILDAYVKQMGWKTPYSPARIQKIEAYLGLTPEIGRLTEALEKTKSPTLLRVFDINLDGKIDMKEVKILQILSQQNAVVDQR